MIGNVDFSLIAVIIGVLALSVISLKMFVDWYF